jgi:chromosome partitioning protein
MMVGRKSAPSEQGMARVIAIASQKGGVGKTTTAINLSACLAQESRHVLMIDLDPQANGTSGLGINGNSQGRSIYELMIGSAEAADCVVPTALSSLDLLPSAQRLSGAEIELVGMLARESRLKTALGPLRDKYDYIILDCQPSLGILTVNALTAADSVLIPLQCEYLALEGLTSLLSAIRLVQDHLNPGLRIEGVLLTMYDARLNLSRQVATEAREYFGNQVFETVIPRNVRLAEAPSFGKPIILYDVASVGAQAYVAVAKELMWRLK